MILVHSCLLNSGGHYNACAYFHERVFHHYDAAFVRRNDALRNYDDAPQTRGITHCIGS